MVEGTIIRSTARFNPALLQASVAVGILVICAFAVFAHVRIAQIGDDYSGRLAVLDRVFDTALALGLLSASFCLGRAIGRKVRLEFRGLAEEVSISTMLGAGVLASCVAILGLSGALKPAAVSALMLLVILISGREWKRLLEVIGESLEAIRTTRIRAILFLTFASLVLILVVRAATPPHNFDEAIYHLPVTKAFVRRGGIHPVYDNFPGNMPLLLHMLYAVCLMAKSDIAAKLFSLGLAVMSSLAIYGFCARYFNRNVGTIAIFGFFGAGMVVEVAVTSRIDVSLAGILFLATYAMTVYVETRKASWLYVSAAFAGFGLSIKYSAAGWPALLLLMFLIEGLVGHRESVSSLLRRGIGFLFVVSIIASPWYFKNLLWFHNPVYPFLSGEATEVGPGVVRYFGDEDERKIAAHFEEARNAMPDVVAELEEQLAYASSQRTDRHPFRFWEYFTAPDKFNISEPYHDPNYLFLFSPVFVFFTRNRRLIWLAVFGIGFYLFIAATSWSGRYLLPIYPGLTVLAAYAINELCVRFASRSRLMVVLPALVVGLAVASSMIVCLARINATDTLAFLRGGNSRRQFMSVMFYYAPLDFINHNLEKDARIMTNGAQMCYELKRDYVVDLSHDSTGWRRLLIRNPTLEGVSRDLKRQGITHILYAQGRFLLAAMIGREGQLDRSASNSGEPAYLIQLRNWATFERFRRDFLDPIYSDERGYQVYAIK